MAENEACEAQARYCRDNGLPLFAPSGGFCFRCGRDIYANVRRGRGVSRGIGADEAGRRLITGCPHCYATFVD